MVVQDPVYAKEGDLILSHGVHIPMHGIRDRDLLADALRRMGETVEVGDDLIVHADDGDRRVEVRCAMKDGYSIGFFRRGGQYHAFADWFWVGRDRDEFLSRVRQYYQLAAVLSELKKEGLVRVVSAKVDPDTGQINIEVEEDDLAASLRTASSGVDSTERRRAVGKVEADGTLHLVMRGYRGESCEQATRGLEGKIGPVVSRQYLPERWDEDDGHGVGVAEV